MNIVKGVADLFWRTSNPQSAECGSPSQSGRFSPPTPEIIFSDVGDEAILKELLERYTNAVDEVEKRKLFHIFLKQFLTVFRDWKPFNQGTPEEALTDLPTRDDVDAVAGCYFGHPAEIILIFIGEVTYITKLLTDNQGNITTSLNIPNESWMALDALTLVTLSIHNCKVFGYHAGIQKLTALMKVTVVQLKTVTSALPTDESLSNAMVENAGVLQKILIHVVSIICNFIDFHSSTAENVLIRSTGIDVFAGKSRETYNDPSVAVKSPASDTNLSWHQTTVVSVMEAGGLNWLLEILRLIRRLIMKELWPDISLQHMTLRALRSALVDNPRGQNHFRSIGGLEVLLDGLGVPSIDSLVVSESAHCEERKKNPLQDIFDIHVLSLEVLREAIFGNLNNLQFLCENGRVQKFANSFCSVAFMLQEYKQRKVSSNKDYVNEFEGRKGQASDVFEEHAHLLPPFASDPFYSQSWKDYVAKLSEALCYFLLDAKETALSHAVPASSRITTLVPAVYAGLSVKWFTRVLLTIFPCIKACSDQEEIPSHLRIFACTMQQHILFAFKKVLLSAPSLIDVFRAEGVWDFIFSENFFYFGPAPAEYFGDNSSRNEVSLLDDGGFYDSMNFEDVPSAKEVEPIQVEVISFMEFAATLSGSSHNLPECTVLVDALEQSVCNPELATALANSLLHILKLSSEKTVSSFKRLAAIPRELKVACVLVQESKRPITPVAFAETTTRGVASPQSQGLPYSPVLTEGWGKCIKKFLELFAEYFSASDEAKQSILCSSLCISCIFDLFWEEDLRDLMLTYVFDLMKVVPSSEEDRKAKSFLCSKYLETFTHLKERVKNFADLSIELLVGMREMLLTDQKHFQILFRDGECFLHVVSLLNGNLDAENGEKLALNVIQTLTSLLSQNDDSKAAFRALVGKDYQTLRSLLLDFCQWQPSELLLSALLDMLVDGDFDLKVNYAIKNEDAILLYLSVLQKSSDSLQQHGLDMFLQLLRDSLSNQASCVRAGMLDFLLNWFSEENCETIVWKVSRLIQVVGGHSISGKDIRKIFALLRSDRAGQQHSRSLLLTSMLAMLNEKGPTAFFDLNGADSGIVIKTPVQWPVNKGFSFTCWLRIESFPQNGPMGLFSFLTENGRGCYAVLGMDKLIYESINQKRQCASMSFNLVRKKWYFFSLVHSVGRAFSGGSQLKCYLDGVLLSSEKCRYPKISEPLTTCTIGTKFKQPMSEDENVMHSVKDALPFCGQIGPTYLFSDAIPAELVRGICSLGPSYMYYFLDNEISAYVDNFLPGGFLDAKDGLASKIIFGLNAQASIGRTLSNVSSIADHANDKRTLEATVLGGTQLCSRRLLQQIIYCVGGVSVFFPLLKQPGMYEKDGSEQNDKMLLPPITLGNLTAETIKLIASVLDDNLANQQQMLLLSGFSVLGFLLQQAPANQLNLETLSALKHLFGVVSNGGLSELLVKDAISYVFLNPHIWVHTVYKVQRELYMFLIQQFDNDLRLLKSLCRLPRVLDIIRQFYWGNAETKRAVRSKQALTDQIVGEKPDSEVHKIRLLLLSLGEMSLREHITASDIKALIAFTEICQDTACIEDILNMIIRAVSDKQLLASFLEQVNIIGGCHIFVNLLSRDFEPVRLLGLQFIGRLLVGLPSEKKVSKFFNIAVGRSKSLSEGHKKVSSVTQTFFSIVSDRIFKYPQTDLLCATLFDVLLGGASPKQVLQKQNQPDRQKNSRNNSEFYLPQILPLIFKYLSGCENRTSRVKIMGDLLDLLDSNPSNIEALMENGWNSWLSVSGKLDVLINYKVKIGTCDDSEIDEQQMVKSIYSLVLSHYVLSVKGGWQNLEETVNFLLIQSEQVGISYQSFVRDIYEDLTQKLINSSAEENIFICQPCRDNTFYLVKLVDEMLISELDNRLPFPACSSKFSSHFPELDNCPDFNDALVEALQGEPANNLPGTSLERASRCVQQVVPALPFLLTPDDDQSKSRLQLFIWSLHAVRSQYGMLDGGVRIHVISRLIRETINCGKSMLATSIMDSDDLSDLGSTSKEGNSILNFIQKDRLLGAVADEVKYIKSVSVDRNLQLDELRSKMEENMSLESTQKKASEDQIQSSLSAILSSDESRRSFCQLSMDEDQQIVSEKWVHIFRLLIDERGPWSANPFPNSIDAHWKLDKTEDGWRRRQKLRRNYHFDDKLCQPSSTSSNNEELLSANDGKFGSGSVTLEKMKQFSVKGIQRITDEGSSEPNENEDESSQQQIVEIEDTSGRQEVTRESTEQEILQDREDYPPVTESETSEVLMEVPCVLVTPRRKLSGRLAIIKKSLHFLAESCVEGTGGSPVQKPEHSGGPQRQKFLKWPTSLNGDAERLGYPENFDIVIGDRCQKQHISTKRHRWWNILDVKAVHWTRFLLRNTAVEIFFVNSIAPIFLNFASQKDAKDVGSLIVKTRNESTLKGYKEKTGVIPFVDRRVAQEMAETAKERWRRREMTNFEYLMILNTLAGRSYNDLTQYPVFPWILADYTSETLDLKQAATFRDLSKPVGALDPKRFEVFEDRYHNFVDPDIPSFYYGSHYSSMGIVLYYLLRLEPFTALHRSLQGGKFDHADRLFHSIESTYRNCLTNTSDVKELIPEFFYMPEFLMNSNSYHFGVKQDGELIRDVCLPPWAKGSAEEFISKNREALESEYVSSNLHNWIDLVFGYKQRGKPAVEAANIFYYLTYEGAVNMDNMEDDLQRSAIEDQIANFGQTPIQIFKKKHPRRGPPIPIAHPLRYAPGSINLTSVVPCSINSSSAVVYINVLDSYIISVDQSLSIYVKTWLTTQLQFGGNFTFSGSQDPFFAIGPDVLPPYKIGSPLTENFEPGAQCFATLQTPSENFLISCGNWENSFQVLSLNDGRMVQSVRHHKDVISCVSVTDDGSILATGSYDTTVMVWEILRVRSAEKRSRNTRTELSWKDCIIADTPFHILCGHDDIITCICASNELDLVISGSKDGTCVFHTIQEGRYVRSIRHPSGRPLSKLVASRHGRIVLYADDLSLHLFSINGRHVSTAESNGRLSCIELSSCGNFLVCAGDQGQITVRSMNSLEILVKYTGFGKSINSLYVTPEECFIAGTKDGNLLVYSIENPQLRKASLQKNSKLKTFVT
ncbi:BEACH domain-containing protein B isoform X2 [Salvia hispanica]|uniref:BEACH domain-containing protein B isoform X2 n=1 Tax=Salvia hispanica TaxID=49212 RepID=UPI00200953AD|nr:BEACH domain-containing protein B isoform X2 [Salvia hispanica]